MGASGAEPLKLGGRVLASRAPGLRARAARRPPGVVVLGVLGGLVVAGLIVGLGPSTGVIAFAGGCAIVGAFVSAETGVALIVLTVALVQREALFSISLPLFGGGLKPTDLLLFATMSGWALRRVLGRDAAARLPRPVSAFVAMFVAWAVACALLGIARGYPYKFSLLELRPLLLYTLFFPIASEFRLASVRRLVWVIKAAAVVVGVRAIALYFLGKGSIGTYTEGAQRITNISFVVLLLAFLLAVGPHVTAQRRRLWSATVPVLSLAALALTFQRAAFVGLGVALVAVFWLLRGEERWRFAGATATLVVAGTVTLAVMGVAVKGGAGTLGALGSRLASVLEFREDVSAQHRAAEWSAAWGMVAEHPVVGNGLGARVQFYSPMYDPGGKRQGYWSDDIYVHNSYVWLLTKTGIIGLGLFAGMMGIGLAKARAQLMPAATPADRHLMIGLLAAWIALLTVSIFGPMVTTDDTVPFMVFILGATFAQMGLRDQPSGERQ